MRAVVSPTAQASSAKPRNVRVEVIGDCSPRVRSVLNDHADWIELTTAHAVAPPDVVLVMIRHPDDPHLRDLAAIAAVRPGARILVVAGILCASAMRTRSLDCAGLWTDEEMFATRLGLELAACRGDLAAEPLPATADRTEVFAVESSSRVSLPPCRVRVVTPDAAFGELCRDELTWHGATVVAGQENVDEPVDTLVVDVDPLEDRHSHLQDANSICPTLVLTSTPWVFREVAISPHHRVVSKHAGGAEWARGLLALLPRLS